MRLIDANPIVERFSHYGWGGETDGEIVLEAVEDAPTVEAAPVVHGRWEWDTEDIYRCSNCYEKSHVKEVMGQPAWDYCPNCGAKMTTTKTATRRPAAQNTTAFITARLSNARITKRRKTQNERKQTLCNQCRTVSGGPEVQKGEPKENHGGVFAP